MAFVKRFPLILFVLALAAPVALAGPNGGGVLVVHTSVSAYSDGTDYLGLSEVGCGLDGPAFPGIQECPPYDPIGGANPCVPTAANPTSTLPSGTPCVWWVMAAFAEGACPRMRGVAFRFDYDESKMLILSQGMDPLNFEIQEASDLDDEPFPHSGSGTAVSFTSGTKTSLLQEIYWFAGYAYEGQGVTFSLRARNSNDHHFISDAEDPERDEIGGYGTLGLGGAVGSNPEPTIATPTETMTWGRIKDTYR